VAKKIPGKTPAETLAKPTGEAGDSAQFSSRAELRAGIDQHGADNVYVEVWRERPGERDPEFCHEYPALNFDVPILLTDFGAGVYQCTLRRRQGHAYVMRRTIIVAGAPRVGTAPTAPTVPIPGAPSAPAMSDAASLLSTGMTMMMNANAALQGLVTTVLARQTAPAADPMELALKLFALVEKRSGGASPEAEAPKDGWEGVASAMVKPIGEAIGQQIRSGMVGGPAAPATQPAPAARQISPSSAPVAAAAPSAPAVADAQAALWTAVQTVLLRGAVNEGDPNAYSDVLLDLIGEDSARELLTAHPGAAVIDFLTAQLPAMAEYVQWLSTVVHAMRLDLELYDPPAPVAPTHNNGVARADAGDPQPVRPGG
jgi:hypothetical protein